ncbi:MAG TPA: hypothetical protein VGF22_14545 [Acidimicrobiales bacterium]
MLDRIDHDLAVGKGQADGANLATVTRLYEAALYVGPTSSSSIRRATTSGRPTSCRLQIGETKYGKFLLEVAVRSHVDLETAVKIALSSMMSTAHANLQEVWSKHKLDAIADLPRLDGDGPP